MLFHSPVSPQPRSDHASPYSQPLAVSTRHRDSGNTAAFEGQEEGMQAASKPGSHVAFPAGCCPAGAVARHPLERVCCSVLASYPLFRISIL